MGGFDDGRMPGVQQYDAGSRVFVCRLWEKPDVAYVMAENAMASTVFDWRGAPPSNEYKQQIVDRSTVRVVVPAEAMKRSGPVDMQLTIRQNGTEERSPILCFPVWKSLLAGEQNYPEPVRVLDDLINRTNETADRVEQLQIDASGLAGDALKLGGKPPEAYTAVNLLDNSRFEIAQAGYGGLHGNTKYAADRWTLSGGTAVWNGSNIVISSEVDGQQVNMVQKLAHGTYKKGTVYTFAVMLADGTLGIVHGDFITNAYANIYDKEGKRVALGIQSDNVVYTGITTSHGQHFTRAPTPPTPCRPMCRRGMLRNCWSVRGISFRWIKAVFALVLLTSGEVPFMGQYIRRLRCAQSHRSTQRQEIIH